MNCFDGIDKECKEHQVGLWRFTGSQQVYPCVGGHTPVVVLSVSVYACKGLFMEEHFSLWFSRNGSITSIIKTVVINCNVHFFKNRRKLKLVQGQLRYGGLNRNAKFIAFVFKISHKSVNPFRDRAKIMIFHLLAFAGEAQKRCGRIVLGLGGQLPSLHQ